MLIRNGRTKVIAAALITILPLALTPAFTATDDGVIHGIVLEVGNRAPMAGIKVHVADPATGIIRTSGSTGDDGAFTVESLPAATYEIGLEKDGRLFLVRTPVAVAPGQSQNIAVAINQDVSQEEDDDSKATFWQNPLTAALLVTGGAILIGLLLESSTDRDSSSISPVDED